MLFRELFEIETKKGTSYTDITRNIEDVLAMCRIKEGLCNIFVVGTKAGITASESHPMLMQDMKKLFELIHEDAFFQHPADGCSHLRAQLTDNEKTIPVSKGKLLLEPNQRVIFWEFDRKENKRKVVVTISGE